LTGRAFIALCALALALPAEAHAYLSRRNISPFPSSRLIVGANWATPRYGPPRNMWGDILPTIWADDGNEYTMVNDGGVDVPGPGYLWRQSVARITGGPPNFHFAHVGNASKPPPHTFAQIASDANLWTGPLGPYYSSGLVEANRVFFATQQYVWNINGNPQFPGLEGIAYSADRGAHWHSVNKHFPAPIGNLSWVTRGEGGVHPDGYVYAIASEREFNASRLIMGRARADVADITDPSEWQWLSGWTQTGGASWPRYSSSLANAIPIVSWDQHITYPEMAYDSPLHRYLLTFTYSYARTTPSLWRDGSELLILEGPHPWGPFSFIAHEPEFGPSNGYAPGFPISWITPSGQDLWMKWTANWNGCAAWLNCSGGYGFNYRRLHLRLAGPR
jgi:hypothetical protein